MTPDEKIKFLQGLVNDYQSVLRDAMDALETFEQRALKAEAALSEPEEIPVSWGQIEAAMDFYSEWAGKHNDRAPPVFRTDKFFEGIYRAMESVRRKAEKPTRNHRWHSRSPADDIHWHRRKDDPQ